MLLSSGIKRIMVCAPSNAAVDEIVHRIAKQGFIGEPDPNDKETILNDPSVVDGRLLRIGAVEYEPSPEVKRHTLDDRLTQTLSGNKAHELKEKIDFARELLCEIKDVDKDVMAAKGVLTC